MKKVLLFSHSGFSDTDANGITMKNLLSAYPAEQKAEFYRDVQPMDYSSAHHYFRVTDMQMMKALIGKKSRHIFSCSQCQEETEMKTSGASATKIPMWLKRLKYSFLIKYIREWLWCISPWGHKQLKSWIRDVAPDVIVYMVGESIFMDKLVMQVQRDLRKPLVVYNGEPYRIVNIKERRGLERVYYRESERLYKKINSIASMVIYNSEMLQRDFEKMYPRKGKTMVAYNSAEGGMSDYCPSEKMNITYFGNLGVGRSDSLVEVASVLHHIDPKLRLDIYGNARPDVVERFHACENIRYHGFVNAKQLHGIIEESDILLHVESFDKTIAPKLKYAFSTKIAQCLQAGRCFVSYAPAGTASSEYLSNTEGAILVSDPDKLQMVLKNLIEDSALRLQWSKKSAKCGEDNHDVQRTARRVKEEIESIAQGR